MMWSDNIQNWQNRYFDFQAEQSLESAKAFRKEKEALIPKSMFKYGHLNNNRENKVKCLKWSRVWLANPRHFNDPFDCLGSSNTLNMNLSQNHLDDILIAMKNQFPGQETLEQLGLVSNEQYTAGQLLDRIDALDVSGNRTEFIRSALQIAEETQFANTFQQYRERQLICCFNETVQSLPMWAHYANNHEGYCVEYDFHAPFTEKVLRNCLYPVIYSEKRVDIGHVGSLENPNHLRIYTRMMNSKATDWSYEREWRFIQPAPYISSSDPIEDGREVRGPKISGLFLGMSISNEDADELSQLANNLKVPCYKANTSNTEYSLKFDKI